mmetsp:Transcript_5829/g.7047  ORF Transcript_5829/g.7047 Transcript_5829/m.7047 type:complete len:339 (-) Transcript_5829:205-1221(-)
MTSETQEPRTPSTPRTLKNVRAKTPKSVLKKTILTYDVNDSYVEEEDTTYLYDETTTSALSEDEDEVFEEEIEDEDFDLDDTEVEIESVEISSKTEKLESENENVKEEKPEESEFRKFLIKHEIPRKILHCSIGFITLVMFSLGVPQQQFVAPLTALFVIILINDIIRLRDPELNKKIVARWWFIVRDSEVNSFNGTLWYLAGVIILFLLAPRDILFMGILLLSWADTAASTIGRQYGKYTRQIVPGKSLAGTLACFLVGVICCYLVYGYFIPRFDNQPGYIMWTPESSLLNLHAYALLSGVIASVSEFVDIFNLDDNFVIPVVGGGLLYGLVKLCQV